MENDEDFPITSLIRYIGHNFTHFNFPKMFNKPMQYPKHLVQILLTTK